MKLITKGLHHITIISGNAQENADFYTGVLGLRLVKKTVNFDDNGTYHLYYGNEKGEPGTIITFFPWEHARPYTKGSGLTESMAYAINVDSLEFWRSRLSQHNVVHSEESRFGETLLAFEDPHGVKLELIATTNSRSVEPWEEGPIPAEHALSSFHSVTLNESDEQASAAALQDLGYKELKREENRIRFQSENPEDASIIDLLISNDARGAYGKGAVHHIAFRTESDDEQKKWLEYLWAQGYRTSNVRDRSYFHSIYFHEPEGVLFEIATEEPGFTADEELSELGQNLKLPPWIEPRRAEIEKVLPKLEY